MTFNLSKKSWLGVARETTAGTAAASPTLYVPQKSVMKGDKKRVYIDDERNTRDANNDVVNTTQEGMVDPKGNWYNDSSVYFIAAGLGGIASAQPNAGTAPTVYKHTITCADQPFSLTPFKGYGTQVYYMPYSVVEKFTIKWSTEGKLLEFDASLKGNFPVPYTGSALTPTYSSVKPFAGYVPTITLGGSATTDIDEVQIEFSQKWTYWFPSGSADFVTAYPGERSVKVDFTARFDSTTIYDKFRNGTDDSFTFDVLGAVIASTYHQELNVQLPLIGYDTVEHDLSKENVLIKAKATARPSADTTTPPINAYVQNTITSYAS